jgi:DNA-binding MarR family transcriptional regulator
VTPPRRDREPQPAALSDDDYHRLLELRDGLRRFLRWSEDQARAAGLTPAQHQLLLAVRGHGSPPSIGDLAEHLLLRHHSVVELINRAVEAGMVRRRVDALDHRLVRVELTPSGERCLHSMAALHREELKRLADATEGARRNPRPLGD